MSFWWSSLVAASAAGNATQNNIEANNLMVYVEEMRDQ
jgi:hypothetical protein